MNRQHGLQTDREHRFRPRLSGEWGQSNRINMLGCLRSTSKTPSLKIVALHHLSVSVLKFSPLIPLSYPEAFSHSPAMTRSSPSGVHRTRVCPKNRRSRPGVADYLYRYYNPLMGRWPSRDPIGERGGFNLYRIARNDLIAYTDTLGLFGNLSGFAEWLFDFSNKTDNIRNVEWNDIDENSNIRNGMKDSWKKRVTSSIETECVMLSPGETKKIIIKESIRTNEHSLVLWVGPFWATIQGKKGGATNTKITKESTSCKCYAEADVELIGEDGSDFNQGQNFTDPFLYLQWEDDTFIWIRDHTPFGYDYNIQAFEESTVNWYGVDGD
jgi:RHS repeat-associated protein